MRFRILLPLFGLLFVPLTQSAPTFDLITDGKAKVTIVYQNEASAIDIRVSRQEETFQAAVDDLARVLKAISGAEVTARAATADDTDVRHTIQIGPTPAAVKAGLVDRMSKERNHTYLIHSDPEQQVLYFSGSTLEGAGHAIYAWLETLGCRWYYPGAEGEKLPSMTTLSVGKLDVVKAPAFELRYIQLSRTDAFTKKDTEGLKSFYDWMRRNKFGGSGPSRGHAFQKIVGPKTFDTHPEYFSLRDGKRKASHLCMTNPDVTKAAVEYLTFYFTEKPTATGFPVALADGAQYCECPDCTKACGGNPREIMGLYLDFTREVFAQVQKKFPDREFQYGFYVYSNLMAPPTRPVPPQLAPYVAPLGYDPFHTFLDPQLYQTLSIWKDFPQATQQLILQRPRNYLLEDVRKAIAGWADGTDNMYLRDYDPYITFAQNMPVVRIYQLALEIPWYKSVGVRGFTPEAVADTQFTSGLNFWVRSRYYWDTELDIKEVMEEYCEGMFGNAAEPMYGFIDALARRTIETDAFRHGDQALTRLYSRDFVRSLDFYLDRAEALADTDMTRRRVRMWRLCQQLMFKYLDTREAELSGNFVDAHFLARDYLNFNDYIETVNPHYISHRWYAHREFSMFSMHDRYAELAAKENGTTGRLLTRLPLNWYQKYDPEGVGVRENWQTFEPVVGMTVDTRSSTWDATAVKPLMAGWDLRPASYSWQLEEKDYEGYNWFRCQADIPGAAKGKTTRLLINGIFGHMDFFINGQRVTWEGKYLADDGTVATGTIQHLDNSDAWSWNYNEYFDVDVTAYLKAGEVNTFAFRSKDMYRWGGIFKSAMLYEPMVESTESYSAPENCDDLKSLTRRPRCTCQDGHAF